jgi:hypothetical protein
MVLQGISGAIDHLAVQPFMGILLNLFNRVVVPRVDLLADHALLANLALATLGLVVIVAADRLQPSPAPQPPQDPRSRPTPPPAPTTGPHGIPATPDNRRPILQAARFATVVAGWVVAGAAAAALFAPDGLTRTRIVRSAAAVALAFLLALAFSTVQARRRP